MVEKVPDKQIIIDGKTIGWATSVKASPESNTSQTATFDGAITQGSDKIAWNLEIEKIRYDKKQKHKDLSELLDSMWNNKKVITIREMVHTENETYTIKDNYYECLLDGNDYEIKADDLTTESLKFKSAYREREYE